MSRALLIACCSLGGCNSPPDRSSAPRITAPSLSHERESIGTDYTGWPKVTEKPFPIALQFYYFCRAPSPEQIQQQKDLEKLHGPHAKASIIVRVNPIGLAQFKAGQPVPVGTMVVKEKYPDYSPDATPAAVAAMIKHEPGYDPEHGDWEYAYEQFSPEHKMSRGKIESCIECHKGTRSTDYLFRPYLKTSTKQ